MADTAVASLTASGALAGTELFYGDDGANDVKVTATQIKTWTSASPTLVTPTLGVASATSINKVALTAPASSATLTIADGKTLTVSNILTLAGTDSTVMTFPSTSATVARTDAANTFTGHQTIEGVTSTGATGTGKFVFDGTPTLVTPVLGVATITSLNKVAITAPATSATLTIPDGVTLTGPAASGTAMTLGNAEAVSGIKTFATGQIVNGTLRLGTVSSVTGQLLLANSSSANLTTIQAGNAAAARTYTWPTNFGAAGTVLTDAAGNGTLSWAAGGGSLTEPYTFTRLVTVTQGTANEGVLASTGYSLTGSNATNMVDLAGTWNTSGAPIGLKINITNTASDAASKIFDLQLGGTSKFNVRVDGSVVIPGSTFIGTFVGGSNGVTVGSAVGVATYTNGSIQAFLGQNTTVAANGQFGFTVTNNDASDGVDVFLRRRAAATLNLGSTDAASPVAQKLSVQGSRAGTDSNVGGANLTVQSGTGTGTGTISSLILSSPIAVGSGTGAQTQTTGFTIKAGTGVLTSYAVAGLPAAATAGAGATAFVTDASTTLILGLGGTVTGGGANKVPVFSDGTNWIYG